MADENVAGGILRRRIGGVPVLYLAVGAVVILAVVAYRMRPSTDGQENVEVPTEERQNDIYEGSDVPAVGYDPFVAKGSVTVAPVTPIIQETEPETNETWLRKAVQWQINKGVSGGIAQEALQAYLAGSALTVEQGAIRDAVLREYGLPPDPPSKTSTAPAPVVARAQGTLPRNHRVEGTGDNSLAKIAALYYPTADNSSVNLLEKANIRRFPNTGPYRVGTLVYVPLYTVPRYYTVKGKSDDSATEIAKKNGTSREVIERINDGVKFPVKKGTRVRVA